MSEKVKIGILGAGFAAHFHLASYKKVHGQEFEIRGIYGRTRKKAEHLAKEYRIPKVFDTPEQLLADKEINVVDIVVPGYLHAAFAIQAAKAGKHIYCEKPLTGFHGPPGAQERKWSAHGFPRQEMLDKAVQEANAVYDAVKKAGVKLCYGENWVYAPPIQKANRLLAASDSTILRMIGEESHSGSHADYAKRWREAGGGSLLRMGVHPIGGALYLKYEEGRRRNHKPIRPASVSAEVAQLTNMKGFVKDPKKFIKTGQEDVEDYGSILLTWEDGSVGQLTSCDIVMGGICNYLTIYGSRAVIKANINPNTAVQAYTPDAEYFKDEYIVEKTETKEGWSCPAPDEDWMTGYHEEFQDFVESVADERQPKSDLLLAHDVIVVTYAGYLAAEKGRRVDLKPYLREGG